MLGNADCDGSRANERGTSDSFSRELGLSSPRLEGWLQPKSDFSMVVGYCSLVIGEGNRHSYLTITLGV
jgi:hypothetical protein